MTPVYTILQTWMSAECDGCDGCGWVINRDIAIMFQTEACSLSYAPHDCYSNKKPNACNLEVIRITSWLHSLSV